MPTLNPVGWGFVEQALTADERKGLLKVAGGFLGGKLPDALPPPAPESIRLPTPRVMIPSALCGVVSAEHADRLLHARGRSFPDLAALREPALPTAPDAVARPVSREELHRVLEWAQRERLAVIPYGGGSSVVGGVNPDGIGAGFNGVVTLSLQRMNRVLEIDTRSNVVHAEAGIFGPDLDAALKPQGLAVRHYPQSYFHSTLGGWVATRGAGHFSTGLAKIEDRVQALGVTSPDGRRAETRPLPASSVGPDPNRLWCGSEGALGVITDARLRCVRLPTLRKSGGVVFPDFERALEAARELVQCGLQPTQMRILDPYEHMLSAALAGRAVRGALMVLAFESAGAPVEELFTSALQICAGFGGVFKQDDAGQAVGDWRNAFFRQPYLRDALLDFAIVSDTFETALPWSAVPAFYHAVRQATLEAVQRACGAGAVSCRSTHAYPDGLCLYFAFFAAGRRGAVLEQWRQIKQAASDAVIDHGGSISHHHAMGRDHKPWARREIPDAFRAAIRAAKRELDPGGILNPGLWFAD